VLINLVIPIFFHIFAAEFKNGGIAQLSVERNRGSIHDDGINVAEHDWGREDTELLCTKMKPFCILDSIMEVVTSEASRYWGFESFPSDNV